MVFTLPQLSYDYDAFAPAIDALTMEIHHTKHHGTYVSNLNSLLEDTGRQDQPIEEILLHIDQLPEEKQQAIINNGGGHLNHSLFRAWLSPQWGSLEQWSLSWAIDQAFWSFTGFQEQFSKLALTTFGSGRAWLCKNTEGKLVLHRTKNQDNPIMEWLTPILGLDVREHAYYLNYQNRRAEYIHARWSLVDWKRVEELYEGGEK